MRRSIRYGGHSNTGLHTYLLSNDPEFIDAIWEALTEHEGKLFFVPGTKDPVLPEKGIPYEVKQVSFAHLLEGGTTDFGVPYRQGGKMHPPDRAPIVLDAEVIAKWPPEPTKITILS